MCFSKYISPNLLLSFSPSLSFSLFHLLLIMICFFVLFFYILTFLSVLLCARLCEYCATPGSFLGFLIRQPATHIHHHQLPGPSYFPSLRGGRIGYHETSAEKSIHRQTGERKVRHPTATKQNSKHTNKIGKSLLPPPTTSRNRENQIL